MCVHYVATTRHAPPMADSDSDGVPDWVEQTAQVMGNVWNREVAELGYRAPLPDRGTTPAGTGQDEGPDTRLDVYLGDIGKDGYYGYAATDRTNPRTSSAYLVLDDDFKDFAGSATPGQLLRVTAAHEFFHIVQFAYDQYEDGWFMESTATWMEERVYDSVNDNRQYLPASAMALPGRSLDYPLTTSTAYGNWIFFEFLSRRLGGARGEVDVVARRQGRRLLHGGDQPDPHGRGHQPARPVRGLRRRQPLPRAHATPRARTTAARRSPRRTRCPPASRAPAAGPPGSTTWPPTATRSPPARA